MKDDANFVSDEVDTCLIVQENNGLTPYAKPDGGNITFNFTGTTDDFFQFQLFNVEIGGTIFVLANDTITKISMKSAVNEVQNVVIDVPHVKMVTIQFDGQGAVCGIKSCLDGVAPSPTPVGYNPPTKSDVPTASPYPTWSSPPSIESNQPTDCYDLLGITEEHIINQIGSEEPIPEDSIKVIHGEYENATIGEYDGHVSQLALSCDIKYTNP